MPRRAHSWMTAVSAMKPFWFVVNIANRVASPPDGATG
jgi:hypothetical protein